MNGENAGLFFFGGQAAETFIRVGVGSPLPGSRAVLTSFPCQSKRGLPGPYRKV